MSKVILHVTVPLKYVAPGESSDETGEADLVVADTIVVTEGAAVLARHQGRDVAAHGARDPVLDGDVDPGDLGRLSPEKTRLCARPTGTPPIPPGETPTRPCM